MLKKILIGLLSLIVLGIIAYFIFINTGIQLPKETDSIVTTVLNADELPELVTGETNYAENEGVKIWYEKIVPQDSIKGTVLLIMGFGATSLVWGSDFYQPLVDAGYQVIRYDNRGVGKSDWLSNWSEENAYSLEDMAKDGLAVLDAAGVEKAHIIGASMGGMIAQRVAISHSARTLSLTSIMSSGYMNAPEVPTMTTADALDFGRLTLRHLMPASKEGEMKFFVGITQLLKGSGNYQPSIEKTVQRTLYESKKRNGRNPDVSSQHQKAIELSGSRLDELGQIKIPTLIIHGKTDPLVPFAHCEKYAPLIPHAKKLFIEGMGHDMPSIYLTAIHQAILDNIK